MQSSLFLPDVGPFELAPEDKSKFLENELRFLREHHQQHCGAYADLVNDWQRYSNDVTSLENYPYFPVSLFKEFELKSTSKDVMVVESSSTTSANASKIFVDKASRKRQAKSANRILSDFVGSERRPYIVFDLEETVRGAKSFSARGAAILSLAHLATEFYFVMRQEGDQLVLDQDALAKALKEIGNQPFLAYGFTFILYQAHQQISSSMELPSVHPDSTFLHSGGWKKLIELAVEKPVFNQTVAAPWGLDPSRIIDFYGTVEQVGMAYPDCRAGYKHVPYWADILIRRSDTLEVCRPGEVGLIQLVSSLPLAAPNHSVLSEDLGEIVMEDGCECGRRGKAFLFRGRAPKSEVRGCSDVVRR